MAVGLSQNIGRLSSYLLYLPDWMVDLVGRAYSAYFRTHFKLAVKMKYGRKYDAPLTPVKLYQIQPDDVQYLPATKIGSTWECSVRGGEWDLNREEFADKPLYKSSRRRFIENVPWTETEVYRYGLEVIQSDGSWRGCNSEDGLLTYLQSYEELYEQIKEDGYKKQATLRRKNGYDVSKDKGFHPPEFNEITVDVGRNGDFLWFSGQHRLSIAKILELDSIPVRIRVRHEKWQQQRDDVRNNPSMDASWHPDLQQPE